jgi:hypothetical protein
VGTHGLPNSVFIKGGRKVKGLSTETPLRFLGLFSVLITVFSASSRAVIIAGPIVDPANGNSYYLLSPASWTASEATAESLGGHLATRTNPAENTWVFNTFSPYSGNNGPDLWLGLNDPDLNDGNGAQHAADFVWSSGGTSSYRNWATGEPNDDPAWSGEYYTTLFFNSYFAVNPGQWNDENNTASGLSNYGLAEITAVPEPVEIGILASALCFSLRRSRDYRTPDRPCLSEPVRRGID